MREYIGQIKLPILEREQTSKAAETGIDSVRREQKPYSFTFHSSTVPVWEEKFTPILYSLRGSAA